MTVATTSKAGHGVRNPLHATWRSDKPWSELRTHWAGWYALASLLWLFSHPYWGIYHDVRIYALLAAQWLDPSAYAQELFFIYGSQGSYTLFTPLFAGLVRWLGLDAAAQSVTLLGALLWIAALLLLSRHILGKSGLALFALLFFTAATTSYSPNGDTFVLNEGFATPRCIVMPLGLLAIYLRLAGRPWQAIILSIFGVALHPLIGIWPLLMCIAFSLKLSRQAALAFCILFVVFAWSFWGITPTREIANDWLAAIASPNNDVLVGSWGTARINAVLSWFFMLLLAGRLGSAALRTLYLSTALMGACAFLAAQIVSLFPTQPFAQLQLWRALWFVIPIAGLGILDAFRRSLLRCRRNLVWWAYLFFACLISTGMSSVWLAAAWGLVFTQGSGPWLRRSIDELRAKSKFLEYGALCFAVLAVPSIYFDLHAQANSVSLDWFPMLPLWVQGLVVGGGWVLPAILAACFVSRTSAVMVLVATLVLLPYAIKNRDQRTDRNKAGESCFLNMDCSPHPFSKFVRPGDVVFDGRNDLYVWFRLSASNYLSSTQAVGVVFSEEKFREWLRRRDLVLEVPLANMSWLVISDQESQRYIRSWRACNDPFVSWIVANTETERHSLGMKGVAPAAIVGVKALFSCERLRAQPIRSAS